MKKKRRKLWTESCLAESNGRENYEKTIVFSINFTKKRLKKVV